jgi:hypothetical protein
LKGQLVLEEIEVWQAPTPIGIDTSLVLISFTRSDLSQTLINNRKNVMRRPLRQEIRSGGGAELLAFRQKIIVGAPISKTTQREKANTVVVGSLEKGLDRRLNAIRVVCEDDVIF